MAMVHQMSGESETTILAWMSFARGLQYQNQWYRLVRNQTLVRPSPESEGLRTVL